MKKYALPFLFSLATACASRPVEIMLYPQPPQPTQPLYQIDLTREDHFSITSRDGERFYCTEKDCTLFLPGNIMIQNQDYWDPQQPIVDRLEIPGFPHQSRRSVRYISEPSSRALAEKRFQEADQIWQQYAAEFHILEVREDWLKRPSPLEKFLKK
jgi:hypothetical protein